MRTELEKKGLRGVKVLEGEASNMSGVESHSVHAVIAAQVRPLVATTWLKWASYADIGAICRHSIGIVDRNLLVGFSGYACSY